MVPTILIVEDKEDIRSVYEAHLGAEGYRTIPAATAVEALNSLHTESPDLILLDIRLPQVSGWDLLQILRDSGRWHDIPVVVVSGLCDAVSLTHGWSLGCTGYLQKPVDLRDLTLMVNRLLAQTAEQPMAMASG